MSWGSIERNLQLLSFSLLSNWSWFHRFVVAYWAVILFLPWLLHSLVCYVLPLVLLLCTVISLPWLLLKYGHLTQNQLAMSRGIHLYIIISSVLIFFNVGLFQHFPLLVAFSRSYKCYFFDMDGCMWTWAHLCLFFSMISCWNMDIQLKTNWQWVKRSIYI